MISWIRKQDKKTLIIMLCAGLLWCFFYLCFSFPDFVITTKNGMVMWDSLVQGRLREFYVMNENAFISNAYASQGVDAIYDITVYIVFAIWDFPLWLYEQLTSRYALDSLIGVIWAKSISIPFLVGCIIYIIKIGNCISKEYFNNAKAILYSLTTMFLAVPIMIMGQYDTVALFFILLGVYSYILNDERMFIVWFMIAMTFKMFALFVFIPLLLLKEKRILQVILKTILGSSLLLLCKLIQNTFFYQSEIAQNIMSGHLLNFVFQSQEPYVYNGVSAFVVLYVLFCFYCFFKKTPEGEEYKKWAIYVSFIGLAIFFISSLTHPQWSLLLWPFCCLLINCMDEQSRKIGLIIDTVLTIGLLLAQIISYYYVFGINVSIHTLAGKLFYDGTKGGGYSIYSMLTEMMPEFDFSCVNLIGGGIFMAGILYLVYWGKPNRNRGNYVQLSMSENMIYLFRTLTLLAIGVLLIIIMI